MAESLKIKEVKSSKKNGVEIERITFSDGKIIYRRLDKNIFLPKDVSRKYLILAREYSSRKDSENEVAMILRERGYGSEECRNKVNKSKKIDFTIQILKSTVLGASLIAVILCAGSVIYAWLCGEKTNGNNMGTNAVDMSSWAYTDYVGGISEQASGQVSDNDEEYSRAEAESEKKYQETLARNKEEYERKKAELDAETERKLEEYDKQRDERNAQYVKEQAEYEAKQSRCNSFKAEYPDVDTYKKKNGLDELYNNWQSAQSAYYSASDSYSAWLAKYGAKHSEEYVNRQRKSVDDKKAVMDAARSAWSSKNNSLGNEYNEKYRQACL